MLGIYSCIRPLQLLLCLFFFSVGLFLTTVIAKVLGRYFHKDVFFDKMADTLKKVGYTAVPKVYHITAAYSAISTRMFSSTRRPTL